MCNMKIEAMARAGETGECFAARLHLDTVKCQATIIDTLRGELAAKEAECANLAKQLARADRALFRAGFQDNGGAEWKPPCGPAPRFIEVPAPVAGSVGDDAIACSSCGLTMEQSRYLDSRPASAPSEEVLSLHRRLAAETFRADQGWERYESANRDRNSIRAALAGAPAETVKAAPGALQQFLDSAADAGITALPKLTEIYAAPQIDAAPPATFALGTIVRKKSGSQWEGAIVGTYSSSITPEGYAVESSTHRGSVQIYPVSALELVTKGNV